MSAAIMQGAPGSTLDYDIWINLPTRQYMRVINIAHKLGAELFSNQSIALNGLSVDLVYEPHGLMSFRTELRGALWLEWQGVRLPVLPLERIIAAKESSEGTKIWRSCPSCEMYCVSFADGNHE